jgi:hypothetical protein
MPKGKSELRGGTSFALATSVAMLMPAEDAIVEACEDGDLAQLQRWGQQGVRVSAWQAWVAAAMNRHPDIMRCLVNDLGADVNQEDNDNGFSPLHIATQSGHLDLDDVC